MLHTVYNTCGLTEYKSTDYSETGKSVRSLLDSQVQSQNDRLSPSLTCTDMAKVILKSGKSESISIIISAMRALIANDGVQYGHRAQAGPSPFRCLPR